MASSNSTMPAPASPTAASTSASASTSTTANVKAKPYVCLTCTRPFARLEHLKRHERSHTKEKPFTCEQAGDMQGCGRSFARRDLLLRHQQKIHLFPNTTKRRRLSTASTSLSADRRKSSAVSIPSAAHPAQSHRITMSMPNLEDLNNFSSGTVNPSSLFSLSPSDSSAHSGVEFAFPHTGYGQTSPPPAPSSTASSDVQWATEKLFPLDVFQSEDSNLAWSMPELLMDVRSPASSVSSSSAGYSPVQATHDVLPSAGGANAQQVSPTGSAFPCAFPTDAYATALYLRNLTMESQRAQLALMQQQHEHQLMQQKEHQQRLSLSQQQQGSSPLRAPYSAEQLKMQVNLQHEQQRQHRQMDLAYAQANPGSYITDLGTSLQYNDEACFPTGYNFASLGGRNFVESF